MSRPGWNICKYLSLIHRAGKDIGAHARGLPLTIAVLAPLSLVATGREGRWLLMLLLAPLVHAFVGWAGRAVQASDRCVMSRGILNGGGVVACVFGHDGVVACVFGHD